MSLRSSKYLDLPDRSRPTDGLRSGGTGGGCGEDLGPALLSLECRNCGTRLACEQDEDGHWTTRLGKCPYCGGNQ